MFPANQLPGLRSLKDQKATPAGRGITMVTVRTPPSCTRHRQGSRMSQ
jgi:hypothetical protein